jgi:hypothetical protein
MDFAFFSGGMEIVQWFLMLVFGSGFIWGVYMVVINVISGLFRR